MFGKLFVVRVRDGVARAAKKDSALERLIGIRVVGSEKNTDLGALWVIVLLYVEEVGDVYVFEIFTLKHKLVRCMPCEIVCGSSAGRCSGCSVCSLFAM